MSDAALAIRKGYKSAFGDPTDSYLMCWAHMKKNVAADVERMIKEEQHRIEFHIDLKVLQLSYSKALFLKGKALLESKWAPKEPEFMAKFTSSCWWNSHEQWYEGAALGYPSTNNGLESFNNTIKKECTLRSKLSMSVFFREIQTCLQRWSEDIEKRVRLPAGDCLGFDLALWREAYDHYKSDIEREKDDKSVVLCPAQGRKIVRSDKSLFLSMKYSTFRQFKEKAFSLVKTYVDNNNWLIKSECTCNQFVKKYMCIHILALAISIKLTKVPVGVKGHNKFVCSKPPRGPPKKNEKQKRFK